MDPSSDYRRQPSVQRPQPAVPRTHAPVQPAPAAPLPAQAPPLTLPLTVQRSQPPVQRPERAVQHGQAAARQPQAAAQPIPPPAQSEQEPDQEPHPQPVPVTPKKLSIWRKIGGGSLSLSIIFHVLLLVIGAYWILRVIPAPEKKVDFMPNGGGGGSGDAPPTNVKRQQALMPKANLAKVVAQGAVSAFTLPDMDPSSALASIESSTSNSLASGGLGGKGAGGGRGDGQGKGFGNGTGMGTAGGGMGNLFGMIGATDSMSGYIYDLTQFRDGRPTPNKAKFGPDNCVWQDPLVSQLLKKGLPETMLNDYYRGPEKLGVHQILIPCSKDLTAPKAFGAEGKMSPGAWVIVYRGRVRAPESGEIRFCGTADNYLGVRFNNKNVLYYASGTYSEIKVSPTEAVPGLRMPIARGDWMRVDKGRLYDMNIVIGDAGGVFSAVLYYERKGDPKTKVLFRTQNTPLDEVLALDGKFFANTFDLPKDLDPLSPVWECKSAVVSPF